MLIKLKWLNNNDASAVVQVFRSTAVIDTANPGAPLVTLPGNATSYDDTAVVAGTKYYYACSVSKGVKKLWTPVKTFVNESRRGPGSSRIIYGDERLGYMGKVDQTDFLDVCKVLGLSAALSGVYRFTWHKFIRKGKVIYIADRPMNESSTNRVHAAGIRKNTGLISGMTWNFDNSAWPDAKKTAIAQKDGDSFHFRALRSLPENWDGSAITAAMIADPTTEFNELIPPLLTGEFYFPNRIGSVRLASTPLFLMGGIACAERQGTNLLARAMQNPATGTTWWSTGSTLQRTKDAFLAHALLPDTANDTNGYRADISTAIWPAFELID
jgi:hypothetical protein